MSNLFTRAMSKATDLTKSGKLREATALIQALLTRHPGTGAASRAPAADTDGAIDGTFTRLADHPPLGAPLARPDRRRKASATPRTPLVETLRRIAAGGMPKAARPVPAPPDLPAGAQFLSLTHASAPGSLVYRLYIPASRRDVPMPLVVMLHGCTQTPEDFAIGTGMNALAEEFGCLIAYPAQPSGANAQNCWNWFRPQDQARDRGEPAVIAGLTRDILRDPPADPARVYVAGLSAGGAPAALVAAAYPDMFCAVGVHSGLPVGGARDVPSAFAAMQNGSAGDGHCATVPTIAFHGLADSTVHPDNSAAVLAQALHARPGLRSKVEIGTARGGRTFRRTSYASGDGATMAEHWQIDRAGHAWSGGQTGGSYTDPKGPDASREMLRFFLQHARD